MSWRTLLGPTLCLLVAAGAAIAAEPDGSQPTDVPDPVGLGERLAIIDWLHDHQVATVPDATLEQLRVAYLRAAHADRFAAPAVDEREAKERDELVLALWRRHGRNPPPDATLPALRELVAALDHEQDVKLAHDADVARRDDRSPAGPAGALSHSSGGGSASTPTSVPHSVVRAAAATAASVAGDIPVDDDHAAAWSNYGTPPSVVKGGIDFRLYVRGDDATHVYLWTNNRNIAPRTAMVTVGARTISLYVYPGRCRNPIPLVYDQPSQATLAVGEVVLYESRSQDMWTR